MTILMTLTLHPYTILLAYLYSVDHLGFEEFELTTICSYAIGENTSYLTHIQLIRSYEIKLWKGEQGLIY